jgi:hypothetical protein
MGRPKHHPLELRTVTDHLKLQQQEPRTVMDHHRHQQLEPKTVTGHLKHQLMEHKAIMDHPKLRLSQLMGMLEVLLLEATSQFMEIPVLQDPHQMKVFPTMEIMHQEIDPIQEALLLLVLLTVCSRCCPLLTWPQPHLMLQPQTHTDLPKQMPRQLVTTMDLPGLLSKEEVKPIKTHTEVHRQLQLDPPRVLDNKLEE